MYVTPLLLAVVPIPVLLALVPWTCGQNDNTVHTCMYRWCRHYFSAYTQHRRSPERNNVASRASLSSENEPLFPNEYDCDVMHHLTGIISVMPEETIV